MVTQRIDGDTENWWWHRWLMVTKSVDAWSPDYMQGECSTERVVMYPPPPPPTHTHSAQRITSPSCTPYVVPFAANFKLCDGILIVFLVWLKLASFFLSRTEHMVVHREGNLLSITDMSLSFWLQQVTAVLASVQYLKDFVLLINLSHPRLRTHDWGVSNVSLKHSLHAPLGICNPGIMRWLLKTEATIHWYIGMYVIQRIRLCMCYLTDTVTPHQISLLRTCDNGPQHTSWGLDYHRYRSMYICTNIRSEWTKPCNVKGAHKI